MLKNYKIVVIVIILILVLVGIWGYVSLPQNVTTSVLPTNTYGMSKYTDSTYGFSFWYPSSLQVTSKATQDSISFPGGVAVEALQIGSMGNTSIVVVNSRTSSITDEPANHGSPIAQTKYSYDSVSKQWMVSSPEGTPTGGGSVTPTPANVSKTTMSGLILLPSGRRFDTSINPLSTTQFLVVSDGGGSSFTSELAQTISHAGASVDSSTQERALQAEATAAALSK